ncbi:MAG TPA: hypothetical protein DFR83_08015 [Deltaproteobacteria bacterium]|nr:hypothetical protein [Deltaproteobacteria bacterium]
MDDANIQIIADWIDAGADCEGIGEDGDDIDDEDDGDDDGGGDGTTDPSEGAAIYAASCSGCHGVDGEGISGFSPSMGEAVADRTAAEVAHIVLNGSGTMGPVALDTDDANTVAEYCVSEFGS